jgi:hypothetical protein
MGKSQISPNQLPISQVGPDLLFSSNGSLFVHKFSIESFILEWMHKSLHKMLILFKIYFFSWHT